MTALIEVAGHVPVTTAEGPGRRFAVWVQGCSLRCPGCCNPHMFTPGRGTTMPVDELVTAMHRAKSEHQIEGLTVLGGEPLQQLDAVTALCRGAVSIGLGVLVFTGYRLDEARRRPGFAELWETIDTLVDGRFDPHELERSALEPRRFIGSRNQGLHHRTARYRDPLAWRGEPRLELHVDGVGGLTAHGEPQAVQTLLQALRAVSAASKAPPTSESA